jgi:copper chaperone
MEENKSSNPATTVFTIGGMSCNHCKMSVEKAIGGVAGVESVNVDLPGGKAYVTGEFDSYAVKAAVKDAGFECN